MDAENGLSERGAYPARPFPCLSYSRALPTRTSYYPIGHLTIPLILVGCFRFGPRGDRYADGCTGGNCLGHPCTTSDHLRNHDDKRWPVTLAGLHADMAITAARPGRNRHGT